MEARDTCIICGEKTFTWGHLTGYAPVAFIPRPVGGLGNVLKNVVRSGGRNVQARACDACGNVQLFIGDANGKGDNAQGNI